MAGPIAEAFVEVLPDFGKFDQELRRGVTQALDKVGGTAETVGETIEDAFAEAARSADESIGDIAGAVETEFAQVRRETEQTTDRMKREFDGASTASSGSLGRITGAIGLIGGAIAAAGIGVAFGFAIDQASDLGESVNAVNKAFGDAGAGVLALGEDAATSLGLSNVEFNALAVRFSSFAETLAGPGGDVVGQLDELTTRASDFASVMNLEVADAAALFQSTLAGETEPIRQYGIDVSAAAVETFAYANGIATAGEELTEAQKIQARYGILLQETNSYAGDFADTADGLANGLRILKSQAADVAAQFGSALLPGLQGVVGAANELLPSLAEPLSGLGAAVSEGITPLFDAIGPSLGTVISAVTVIVEDFAGILGVLAPLLEPILAIVTSLATVLSGALASAFDALAPSIELVAEFLGDVGAVIGDALVETLAALQPLLSAVGNLFRTGLAAVLPIILDLVTAIAPIFQRIASLLTSALAPVLPIIGQAFQRIATALEPVIPLIGDALLAAVEALAPLLPVIAESLAAQATASADLLTALVPLLPPLLELVTLLLNDAIAPAILLISEALGLWAEALSFIVDTVVAFVDLVVGAFQSLYDILVGNSIIPELIEAIVQWFTDLPGMLLGALADLVATVVGAFVDLATDVITGVAGFITDVVADFGTLPLRAVEALASLGADVLGAFASGFATAFVGVTDFVTDVIDEATALPGKIVSALGSLGSSIFGALSEELSEAFGAVSDWIGDVLGAIAGLPSAASEALGDLAGTILDALRTAFEGVWNRMIDALPSFSADPLGRFGPDINVSFDFLKLANGMIVDRPTLGVFGEAGTEAVIPITRPARALELLDDSGLTDLIRARDGAGGAGGPTVAFYGGQTFQDATDVDLVAQRTLAASTSRTLAAA